MSLFGNKEKHKIEYLQDRIAELEQENKKLLNFLTPEQEENKNLSDNILQKENILNNLSIQINEAYEKIKNLKDDIIVLEDEILYQDFALYQPIYDFANSDEYKNKLDTIRTQQKQMIKNKKAVSYYDGWTVNGSKAEGRKMTNDNIKQILRSFNAECENAIDRVKFNNVDSMRQRINKSYESLNKLNKTNKISITPEYYNLKIDELNLSIEYAIKKHDEKEQQKEERARLREEARVLKELEEARKAAVKERQHYENALKDIEEKLKTASEEDAEHLKQKQLEIINRLHDINKNIESIDYKAANTKVGYVYIISNIGAFGENIYKIGMTRRENPYERIYELGDASVPFNFDVHAMIFSDDAPKLEAALHKRFADKKLNCINLRREFFAVTLDEIKQAVQENYDKNVEFINIPPAEQYRQSLLIKKNIIASTM